MSMYAVAVYSVYDDCNKCLLVLATDEKDAILKAVKEYHETDVEGTDIERNLEDYMIKWYEELKAFNAKELYGELRNGELSISKPVLISKTS